MHQEAAVEVAVVALQAVEVVSAHVVCYYFD